ncbi:hypothetical protein MKEN_00503900 [Mycena kentingensis (nom. inval.)]|nr:hypothetical protein MKEN_00503900 [Mycena kentingensis (nom. inval.)]
MRFLSAGSPWLAAVMVSQRWLASFACAHYTPSAFLPSMKTFKLVLDDPEHTITDSGRLLYPTKLLIPIDIELERAPTSARSESASFFARPVAVKLLLGDDMRPPPDLSNCSDLRAGGAQRRLENTCRAEGRVDDASGAPTDLVLRARCSTFCNSLVR